MAVVSIILVGLILFVICITLNYKDTVNEKDQSSFKCTVKNQTLKRKIFDELSILAPENYSSTYQISVLSQYRLEEYFKLINDGKPLDYYKYLNLKEELLSCIKNDFSDKIQLINAIDNFFEYMIPYIKFREKYTTSVNLQPSTGIDTSTTYCFNETKLENGYVTRNGQVLGTYDAYGSTYDLNGNRKGNSYTAHSHGF